MAEFLAERYVNAVPWFQKALQVNPRFLACLRHLTTTLAHLNRMDEARRVGLQLLELEPGFRVGLFASWYPLAPKANLDRYVWGLRAAGLPE
jgi:tetratricopeptide (TPR) repeat protein